MDFTQNLGQTQDELHAHISSKLSTFSPLPLVMRGISAHRQPDGHYIFLDVAEGAESIRRISGRLYEGALEKYISARYNANYMPHVTLGRLQDETALQSALMQIGDFSHKFPTTVHDVDVEVIGDDGLSAIEMSIPFPITP